MDILWAIIGIIVPLLLGSALTLIGLPKAGAVEFGLARGFVGAGALLLAGMTVFWLSTTGLSFLWRVSAGALIGVLVIAGTAEAFQWLKRREALVRPQAYEPVWEQVDLKLDFDSPNPPKEFPNDVSWRDISWVTGSRGWLGGAISEGGGHGEVGIGILLARSAGETWRIIPNEQIKSGSGTFTWGPQGNRPYRWEDVGPINAILFYKSPASKKGVGVEGWAATATGVYRSSDGGETWDRSTPLPNSPDRYAFFSNIVDVEGFAEVYAVGWQGIAHWRLPTGWELQLPAYYFNIAGVSSWGGSENRQVWAAGRSGEDELGRGDQSHGAIYSLASDMRTWEKVPIENVTFQKGQGFNDIIATDTTVLAVGDKGLIVRGSQVDGVWRFNQVASGASVNLSSIAAFESLIYTVGEKGMILYSRDGGLSWHRSSKVVDQNDQERDLSSRNLRRVRFNVSTGTAWILGDGIVLKNRAPQSGVF